MNTKRTMTLNLNSKEMEEVERLAIKKGISKTGLVRQAIRLYQSIIERIDKGEKLFFEDKEKSEKAEILVL